jgi:hypothetical protein
LTCFPDFYANKRHKGSDGQEEEEFSSSVASVSRRHSAMTQKTKKNSKKEVSQSICYFLEKIKILITSKSERKLYVDKKQPINYKDNVHHSTC